MKPTDVLNNLSPSQLERALGRLEGMEIAMRIARNRAADLEEMIEPNAEINDHNRAMVIKKDEAHGIAAMIRIVQVNIGNGSQSFGDLRPEEIEEVRRIV
jgi:hypothetical protein